VKYQLGDHLGSSNLVLEESGDLINREEFTPYGETSFGSFALKRYRFAGKETDEESGLCYFGARCYARWVSCDPAGEVLNLYIYVLNNPLNLRDPYGLRSDSDIPDYPPMGSARVAAAQEATSTTALALRRQERLHLFLPSHRRQRLRQKCRKGGTAYRGAITNG
jgi:RHS repeat-associated protein